ncbi:hypothetical protein [Pseudoruegeria sp. HB172150]|uniref:hypothetical protein n=1 Tax=Pseudoruegeria sp. HB172150 TaxID=2721164 RepID=UPI00155719D2|nr:hypothetical protein [Pseudoruegeria sp. HB172150]
MRDPGAMLDELLAGTLAAEGFGHREHVAVAHAALCRWEFFEAAWRYSSGLRALTERAGVPEKFNATLTLAFLSLIAERMGQEDSVTFVELHTDLGMKLVRSAGYDAERLADPKARTVGLLPVAG